MESIDDLPAIERALQAVFPALAVAPLTEVERGFGSIVVETSGGLIFRVARHEHAAAGHSRELSLLPVLRATLPVAVPNPEWRVEPGIAGLTYGAIGYRKLAGVKPAEASVARGAAALTADVAAFLVALHGFPLEHVERLRLPLADRERTRFDDLCRATLPLLEERLTPVEFRAVVRWANGFRSDMCVDEFEPSVRHGDLWYGNLLVAEASGRLAAVLDWEAAAIGDRASDFARQLHLGEAFTEAVLQEYEQCGGAVDDRLRHRIARRWELLEFAGVPAAARVDGGEIDETIEKLRRGPILA